MTSNAKKRQAEPEALDWFTVYVELRREQLVQAELRLRGFDAYTPCETVWASHGGKKTAVQRPFLPRYVFVGLDPEARNFPLVAATRGVDRVIGTAAGPTRIPYSWVAKLRAKEAMRGFDETYTPELVWAPGQKVQIVSGPYEGHLGEVIRARGKKRIELFIAALGALGDGLVADMEIVREAKAAA